MQALVSAHSGLRWIALVLLVFAIINAFTAKKLREKAQNGQFVYHDYFSYPIVIGFGIVLYFQ